MSYQKNELQHKIRFSGKVTSIQVRSTVWRYITHNRTHREIEYNIFLKGTALDGESLLASADEEKDFSVAISEKQLQKLQLEIGNVTRVCWMRSAPEIGDWMNKLYFIFFYPKNIRLTLINLADTMF